MWWIIGIGIVVVAVALYLVAKRRNRRDPSYDASTQGRIDDHKSRSAGNNTFERFGGGSDSFGGD